jgi:hypothetical protein
MSFTSQIMGRRYRTTEEANATLSRLATLTGWRDHTLSRLAIARSLREPDGPPAAPPTRKGKEIKGETLFRHTRDPREGSDPALLPWFVALLTEHHGAAFDTDDEAYEAIIAHWHRGLDLLIQDLDASGGAAEFIISLARKAAETAALEPGGGAGTAEVVPGHVPALTVTVGQLAGSGTPLSVTLNDARVHSNCHVAVSGMSGSGKTQLGMQLVASALRQAGPRTGLIFIDFAKGDVADNQQFVTAAGARVIRLPGTPLPVGPFHLTDYSPDALTLAAEDKREVYANLFPSALGAKQQNRLFRAVRGAYDRLVRDRQPAPDFTAVHQELQAIYDSERLQPDSLSELFRRLTSLKLFWSRQDPEPPPSPLHAQRWVVDVHELGGLREVTAFTLIEQLYREMRGLGEATVDAESGLRETRCLLVIDEAQYYLGRKNRFVQGLIREGRSKGFAVFLLCQSPDDFDQPDFDYTEQLEFTFMLKCKTAPKAVQRLLGCSAPEARRLATDLGKMETLWGVGRVADGGAKRTVRFRLAPFFEVFPS